MGRQILTIEASGNPLINVEDDLKQIDRMAKLLALRMVSEDPKEKLHVISEYLRGGLAIRYERDQPTLHGLLARHRGNCEATTLLYVVLGQRLGLPLQPVLAPNHVFVFWADGARRLYWETTSGGGLVGTEKDPPPENPLVEMTLQQTLALPWQTLALTLAEKHQAKGALHALDEIEKVYPTWPALWNFRGKTYFALGQFEQAIRASGKDAELHPSGSGPLNKSIAECRLSRYEDAAWSIRGFMQTHPGEIRGLIGQSRLFRAMEDYEQAIVPLDQAIQSLPDDSDLWYRIAECQYDLGRFHEAMESVRQATRLSPRRADAWGQQAACSLEEANWDDAIAESTRAIDLKDWPDNLWVRSWARLQKREYAEALSDIDRAIQMGPGTPKYRLVQAWIFLDQKRLPEAEAALNKMTLSGRTVSSLYGRAACWWELHKYSRSVADGALFVQLAPAHAVRDAVRAGTMRFRCMVVKSILAQADSGK